MTHATSGVLSKMQFFLKAFTIFAHSAGDGFSTSGNKLNRIWSRHQQSRSQSSLWQTEVFSMGKVRVRKETGNLQFDFFYQGYRCREQTLLPDSPDNRKKLETFMLQID